MNAKKDIIKLINKTITSDDSIIKGFWYYQVNPILGISSSQKLPSQLFSTTIQNNRKNKNL